MTVEEKVQEHIAKDKLKEALIILYDNCDESDSNTIVLLQSRLNRLNNDIRGGIVSNDNATTERNRIVAAIISLSEDNNMVVSDTHDTFNSPQSQQPEMGIVNLNKFLAEYGTIYPIGAEVTISTLHSIYSQMLVALKAEIGTDNQDYLEVVKPFVDCQIEAKILKTADGYNQMVENLKAYAESKSESLVESNKMSTLEGLVHEITTCASDKFVLAFEKLFKYKLERAVSDEKTKLEILYKDNLELYNSSNNLLTKNRIKREIINTWTQ